MPNSIDKLSRELPVGFNGVKIFFFSNFRLPAIASRAGEAGGDESAEGNPLARTQAM
jgi:hypothetical protein